MQDHLVRIVSKDGLLRGMAADTTVLVREICQKQQTDLTATVALGRLLTGGALLGCLLKGKQRLALMVEGNGPLGKLSVETDADGRIRGSIRNPIAGLPPKGDRFDIAGAVGNAGFLHVWKDLGLKEPYQSMVQLQTSEIAEDLAWYLANSEQVPSSVALGVELDAAGEVAAAGGMLIQSLPPGNDEQVEKIITKLRQLPPTTSMLRQGLSPAKILAQAFDCVDFSVQATIPLKLYCPCNEQQIERMLTSLGAAELQQIVEERGEIEVICEYCRTLYRVGEARVKQLIDEA